MVPTHNCLLYTHIQQGHQRLHCVANTQPINTACTCELCLSQIGWVVPTRMTAKLLYTYNHDVALERKRQAKAEAPKHAGEVMLPDNAQHSSFKWKHGPCTQCQHAYTADIPSHKDQSCTQSSSNTQKQTRQARSVSKINQRSSRHNLHGSIIMV